MNNSINYIMENKENFFTDIKEYYNIEGKFEYLILKEKF